jgi:predicted hydrocarbon binding protein
MNAIEGEKYFYPNRWARIILTSAEEIVGPQGVTALLNMAGLQKYIGNYPPDNMDKGFSFTEIGRLQQAFWDMYGARGARVFATRAGRQSFKDGLTSFGNVAKAAQVAMKIGAVDKRIQAGLFFFAKFFNTVSDQVVRVEEDENKWYWIIERDPLSCGRNSDQPVGHLAIGVLQGALNWASEGKQYRISQTKCISMGEKESVFEIDKVALE